MQLLSVIVPVYNVEKFINDCIDSILGQSYKDSNFLAVRFVRRVCIALLLGGRVSRWLW